MQDNRKKANNMSRAISILHPELKPAEIEKLESILIQFRSSDFTRKKSDLSDFDLMQAGAYKLAEIYWFSQKSITHFLSENSLNICSFYSNISIKQWLQFKDNLSYIARAYFEPKKLQSTVNFSKIFEEKINALAIIGRDEIIRNGYDNDNAIYENILIEIISNSETSSHLKIFLKYSLQPDKKQSIQDYYLSHVTALTYTQGVIGLNNEFNIFIKNAQQIQKKIMEHLSTKYVVSKTSDDLVRHSDKYNIITVNGIDYKVAPKFGKSFINLFERYKNNPTEWLSLEDFSGDSTDKISDLAKAKDGRLLQQSHIEDNGQSSKAKRFRFKPN